VRPDAFAVLLRRGAAAVAVGRVALGVTALAWPTVPGRPWVGAAADGVAGRVLGRALGARDIALGVGALAALRDDPSAGSGAASAWFAAGALADALDVAASLSAWRELPRAGRWMVAVAAGGAAVAGAAGALAARRLSSREREMGDAARGAYRLHVETLLKFFQAVPEPLPASKDDRHYCDVHLVDQVRG
jgi:hypothetical protein